MFRLSISLAIAAVGIVSALVLAAENKGSLPPLAELKSVNDLKPEAGPFHWIMLDEPDITLFIFGDVAKVEEKLPQMADFGVMTLGGGVNPLIGSVKIELASGMKITAEGDRLKIGGREFRNKRPNPGFSVVVHRDGSLEKYPGYAPPKTTDEEKPVTLLTCGDALVNVWTYAMVRTVKTDSCEITVNNHPHLGFKGSAQVQLHKGPLVSVGKTVTIAGEEFRGSEKSGYLNIVVRDDSTVEKEAQLRGPL